MNMLATRYPPSEFAIGDRRWTGRLAPDCEINRGATVERLFTGRRGKFLVVCYALNFASKCALEAVEISIGDGAEFRRTWKVSGPFCAIVRPDGFIAWAKKRPSPGDLDNAANEVAKWSGRSALR